MAHKVNKEKGVASSSHGNKGSRGTQEAPMEDSSIPIWRNYTYSQWTEFDRKVGPPLTVQIDEEVVDYRPRYDPEGIDVTKTKDPKGIHGSVLSISERNACINNVLSHLYGIVGPSFEEPFDDDEATGEENAIVYFDLESDDDGDDSKMGEVVFDRTNHEH
ncbi:hypothetical protein HAX54_026170 [Datura stramonium]|uniref:Uncharacterized protein n=1 Tax=Datura stramonium TaxID=4076 RepID=A0ABS8S6V6_DATST|nr:hypothetical protein [Datura stramonium]